MLDSYNSSKNFLYHALFVFYLKQTSLSSYFSRHINANIPKINY